MLSRNVAKVVEKDHGGDFSFPFRKIAPLVQGADLAFANLECPISGRGKRLKKTYAFNAPPAAADGLALAGFDIVSLANNHTLDFGPEALLDSERLLAAKGVARIGLVRGDDPHQEPVILNRNGVPIGWLAYVDPQARYVYPAFYERHSPRPAKAVETVIADDLARLKPRCDVIVVSMHWGTEYHRERGDHRGRTWPALCPAYRTNR
jgi:poly-gamma-glutamate synthesis protein (capsule biosynthesis protein)